MKQRLAGLLACFAIVGLAATPSLPALAQDGGDAPDPMEELKGPDVEVGGAVPSAEAAAAEASVVEHHPLETPPLERWSFAGFFGRYDTAQLQRGFQVYREVCSLCHSMDMVAFRNLGSHTGPGFTEEEVKALAAEYQIGDGPDQFGDMFERPGKPSDYLPAPFPNPEAAAAANGGAIPPDLSLIAKARAAPRGLVWGLLDFFTQYQEGGPDYVHALLTGYGQTPPPGVDVAEGTYFNPYFLSGSALAMPPPLSDDLVAYADGSPQTVDQYARDVSAYLMWVSEPHLVDRKRVGFQAMIFLIVFAVLMYLTKQRVWARIPH
jgi:ubiquinol-cytochrome c reductase cytochrome c1 subunit